MCVRGFSCDCCATYTKESGLQNPRILGKMLHTSFYIVYVFMKVDVYLEVVEGYIGRLHDFLKRSYFIMIL